MATPKKTVNSAAIAAGALCVVLAIAVVAIYFEYNTAQTSYNSELQTYANYQSSYSHSNSDYGSVQSSLQQAQSQVSQLQSELNNAQGSSSQSNAIANLQQSSNWLSDETVDQDRGSYAYYTESANYAGYVSVNIATSTTSNQYVEAIWSSHGVSYDNKITVGTSGTAVFPVLPSSNVQIRIGNTNLLNGATATVTITYTY